MTDKQVASRTSNTELTYFAQFIGASQTDATLLKPTELPGLIKLPERLDEFVEKLDHHGLTALALSQKRLPAAIEEQLKPRTALSVANETLKSNALVELFESFASAGLTHTILFKGSALAHSIYPKPWLRPRSDNDLLIDIEAYSEYEKIFARLGYQKIFSIEGQYVSYQNTFSKKLSGHSHINIDLHWRISNRQILANSYSVAELMRSGNKLDRLSSLISIPSAVDSLIIASFHRLGHHHHEERLIWLYDIHLLATQLSPKNWTTLIERCNKKALSGVTLDALSYCQKLFNTDIEPKVLQALKRSADQPEPSQIFLQRELAQWQYFLHDIKSLDSWRSRLRLIIENVFPSPDYIRIQMGTKSACIGYFKRFDRGLRRLLNI